MAEQPSSRMEVEQAAPDQKKDEAQDMEVEPVDPPPKDEIRVKVESIIDETKKSGNLSKGIEDLLLIEKAQRRVLTRFFFKKICRDSISVQETKIRFRIRNFFLKYQYFSFV